MKSQPMQRGALTGHKSPGQKENPTDYSQICCGFVQQPAACFAEFNDIEKRDGKVICMRRLDSGGGIGMRKGRGETRNRNQ